jgi:hypothetical protein
VVGCPGELRVAATSVAPVTGNDGLRILVVNAAGSSSLKLRVLGPADKVLATADLPALRGDASADAATLSGALDGYLPDGQVVGGTPPPVEVLDLDVAQGVHVT